MNPDSPVFYNSLSLSQNRHLFLALIQSKYKYNLLSYNWLNFAYTFGHIGFRL